MGDYFDEMGWEPVPLEETQRHQNLLVIRELIANGLIRDDLAFDLPPPASRQVVQNLKERTPQPTDESCTICLKPNGEREQQEGEDESKFLVLPCNHEFHKTCIMPWLQKVGPPGSWIVSIRSLMTREEEKWEDGWAIRRTSVLL